MRLLRKVQIENFRSLRSLELSDLGDAIAFVGANGVGKSNIFRSLNLFFNDEVEPGIALDLQRDFHNPRSKKQKTIRVAVLFDFPEDFHLHKSLRPSATDAGFSVPTPAPLAVRKTWTFDVAARRIDVSLEVGSSLEDLGIASPAQRRVVEAILALIRYRYIPNHVHPATVLQAEEVEVRSELLARLKKRKAYQEYQKRSGEELFNELGQVARDIVEPITERLIQGTPVVQSVELETPSEFSDLAWDFALRLETPGGESFESLLQGSGTQAHLMYLLLDLVDNSYGRTFGWRQAVIWALEEPESYLHSDLQVRVAEFIRTRSGTSRLQVLHSTHSPVFMTIGDSGFLIETDSGASTTTRLDTRELVARGFAGGVSAFVHPLVVGVPRPLLLVEGPSDAKYLETAYRAVRQAIPWEIRSLDSLDPTVGGGGVDQIIRYLDANQQAINARPLSAPVVVLLDWEVPDSRVERCSKALVGHAASRAYKMPDVWCNPDLDESFRGIERFLGTALWKLVASAHDVVLHRPADKDHPLRITNTAMEKAKQHLQEALDDRASRDDVVHLIRVIEWLDQGAGEIQTELWS